MLIKEARLRSIIRSIIKEGWDNNNNNNGRPPVSYKFPIPPEQPYEDERPDMPRNLPVASIEDWNNEDEYDSDYSEPEWEDEENGYLGEEELEGEEDIDSYDDDSQGWAYWEQTHPGMEPEIGDEVNIGRDRFMYDGDTWIRRKRY